MTEPKIFWSLVFSTILLTSGIAGSIQPVSASEEGYFENNYGKQISRPPTVCIFQPDDPRISEQRWDIWYSDMIPAIDTWKSVLQQSGSGNWDITTVEIPLNKVDLLNYEKCDILVNFVEKPDTSYENYFGRAFIGTGIIEIVYSNSYSCGTEYNSELGFYVVSYCFTNLFKRSKLMANTLQHEFGHILGLGHYRGYDQTTTEEWYNGKKGSPSIMAWIEPNEEMRQISKIDIDEIRRIYGYQGFGKKTNDSPVFNEPIIEPKHEPEVSGVQNIQVKPYQTSSTKITGYIPEELYSRGTPVEFEVTKPNGSKESFATMVNRHQYFEYPMVFDSNSMSGTYQILVIYKGEFVQKNAVNLSKSTTSYNSQKTTLPNSNTATGTYLTKISITSENNEYYVKSVLGKTDSSTSSIRITAENECPMKKQVFQKDFLFKTGNEVSFSFYQTNQGKPSQCAIYFSITDFNGKKLDSIKTSYELQPINKQNLSTNQITKPETQASNPVFTEHQKQVLTTQIDSTSISLLKLKENMDAIWGHMMDVRKNYKSTQAQEHIDKAWDVYNGLYSKRNTLGKNLDGIVVDFLRFENSVDSYNNGNFNDYLNKLNSINSQITKINSDTKYISQELDYAKKAEDERNSTSKSAKSGSQCFLFWC